MSRARVAAPAALLLLAACASRPPAESELFLLRPAAPDSRPVAPAAPVLRLAPVDLAAHLRGLSYVESNGRVTTLVNVRFAAPLAELIEDAVVDRLRASGRFSAVLPHGHPGRSERTLRLRVRRCEIDASGAAYEAVVALEGTLDDDASRLARPFRAEGRATPRGEGAAAHVRALEDALRVALDGLERAL
ncbi:MAG TPA: ABC-type transport auxiliary lipoprotein family protein [Planctomycetota bacterium]|nr:ABC-type transport auxiliary lipoprotein family protein [Planctomycetota bacterium]